MLVQVVVVDLPPSRCPEQAVRLGCYSFIIWYTYILAIFACLLSHFWSTGYCLLAAKHLL